jgi:hypothetical protein
VKTVTLRHPSGELQDVVLDGIPAVGDDVRPIGGKPGAPALRVVHRLFVEFDQHRDSEAKVVLVVRPRTDDDKP